MLKQIIFDLLKEHPKLFLFNLLVMLFVPIQEVLLPYMYGKVISNIASKTIAILLTCLVVVLLVVQLGYVIRDTQAAKFIPITEGFIKTKIVESVLDKHQFSVVPLSTGDLIYRLTRIPQIVTMYFQWFNDYLIPYSLVMVVATIYFFILDIGLGSLFVIYICILGLVLYNAPRRCNETAKRNDNLMTSLHERFEDILQNMGAIFASNTKRQELEKLKEETKEYQREYRKSAVCVVTFKTVMIPVTTLAIVIFIIRSRTLLERKHIKTSHFTSSFMILTAFITSIFWIVDILKNITFDIGTIDNLDEVLAKPKEIPRLPPIGLPPEEAGLGISDVTFAYDEKKVVFKDKSIHFEKGKITLLLAPVGQGKSTLFKLLLGFAKPSKGDVYMDGKWYADMDLLKVRDKIGYVPQNPVLFNNTVLYNIQYGNSIEKEIVVFLIETIGLHKSFLDRQVGKGGMNLSGGQRQLVWCLRVLFKNPEYILMDEPTASMDLESKNILMALLETLFRKKTIILVTHDQHLMDVVDNKIFL